MSISQETHISLAHGNGGRFMRELIDGIFFRHLNNPLLNTRSDAASLPELTSRLKMTTDGFIVNPLEFPGGDIGSLAIHGTVNDLAVSGAEPKFIALNAFIEEGLEIALLDRLVGSLAAAARNAGVQVVAGDTKVVSRGEGGGLYLATTGIGCSVDGLDLDIMNIRPGDKILVSGSVGDHGTAIMLAREQFGMSGDLKSDSAHVLPLTRAIYPLPGLRFLRDPTRGGIVSIMQEIRQATGLGVRLSESGIPILDPVASVCSMLGYDPLYLACEGRVVAVVANDSAQQALASWRALPDGENAAIVGEIENSSQHVILETELGGERILEELEDDPLPRIC